MADDEVEELLKAAQDEITLKLSINSHTSRSSNLDPDLHSRFLALKSLNNNNKDPKPTNSKVVKDEDEDDLMLRFAALKNTTLPSSSSCSDSRPPDQIGEDDEVEKLIQWAIDAARLDPSPPSDDDDDDHSDNDSDVKP